MTVVSYPVKEAVLNYGIYLRGLIYSKECYQFVHGIYIQVFWKN